MPWSPENGPARHTKKAKSLSEKRRWAVIANDVLSRTGDEGLAVKEANGVIKKRKKGKK